MAAVAVRLLPNEIAEYRRIMNELYGLELTEAEAAEQGRALIEMVCLLTHPKSARSSHKQQV